ncbi:hypothetical protein SAMN05443144_10774 [Fodinibius roseus]|uniref:Uncharacterized protein n=1 Tax=Fodinibius roseus TaxID=1194090 RepID=A0A1M5AI27_9BACT|nr:hypothetical protein SAMN05443144_10774 [Fodinibius roseus]
MSEFLFLSCIAGTFTKKANSIPAKGIADFVNNSMISLAG